MLCNVLAFVYIAYALLLCGFIIPLGTPPFFLHSERVCSLKTILHFMPLSSLRWPFSARCRPAIWLSVDLKQGHQQGNHCFAWWGSGSADEALSLCRVIASVGGLALLLESPHVCFPGSRGVRVLGA